MMPTQVDQLLEYIRNESALRHAPDADLAPSPRCDDPHLRLPLEVQGSLWCAEIEQVDRAFLRLVVDQKAMPTSDADAEAAIWFQPENGPRHRTPGRLTHRTIVSEDRVRLNFELS